MAIKGTGETFGMNNTGPWPYSPASRNFIIDIGRESLRQNVILLFNRNPVLKLFPVFSVSIEQKKADNGYNFSRPSTKHVISNNYNLLNKRKQKRTCFLAKVLL